MDGTQSQRGVGWAREEIQNVVQGGHCCTGLPYSDNESLHTCWSHSHSGLLAQVRRLQHNPREVCTQSVRICHPTQIESYVNGFSKMVMI